MQNFANLYTQLDATTSSNAKLAALQSYFSAAAYDDAAWAVYFLAGGKPRQLISTRILKDLAIEASGLTQWLFDECYQSVGDLAETITLILPVQPILNPSSEGLSFWMENLLLPLRGLAPELLTAQLLLLLQQLDKSSQLVCIKLITGSFRVGVSKLLVTRALGALVNIDSKRIAQRLVGFTSISTQPTAAHYQRLIATVTECREDERDTGQPYPFFLAHPLQIALTDFETQLGATTNWQIEWKWDGIRAQLVKRNGQLWLWSRGEELVTDRFPELAGLASFVPDGTVLDGEIVSWNHTSDNAINVQPFALLQQRLGRKTISARLLHDIPVVLVVYDLLEWRGIDWRQQIQSVRRSELEVVVAACAKPQLVLSPLLLGENWADLELQRASSRDLSVEGLMLKSKSAEYGVGRTKNTGLWWKWKIQPYTVDAVLIYAQRGHGRRASMYSDFTFAVWDAPEDSPLRKLVPFAKAYSGLTDIEMQKVDAIIRKTTVEKFGPVRSVIPSLIFELGFEGIALSARHKSGIAVRFPRMLRWRHDKPLAEADTLATLRALLPRKALI